MRKKDIFAMIRQLSLPTWFMSLSAADTRWTDLLKMLAKLNDGIEYSETELKKLTWQEKTKLVQKDPITCSRYFDNRVQEFLNTILKAVLSQLETHLTIFIELSFSNVAPLIFTQDYLLQRTRRLGELGGKQWKAP